MRKIIATTVAAAALFGIGSVPAEAATRSIKVSAPCVYEDGSGQRSCYWNGGAAGNGIGSSFVNFDNGTRWVYVKRMPKTINKRSPLVVKTNGKTATVIYGRTVLAKNVKVYK